MSTVAELEIAADEFALVETLERFDGIDVEFERTVASGTGTVADSYLRFRGIDDIDRLERALEADSDVVEFTHLATFDDGWLYELQWDEQPTTVLECLGTWGMIRRLGNQGQRATWRVQLLFADRESLGRTYDACEDVGITVDVLMISTADAETSHRNGLTERQQRALSLAYEHGYYEIPRGAQAQQIADEIGISHQALSELLRRGHKRVVETAINADRDGESKETARPKEEPIH